MKRITLLSILLISLGALAEAQETYSIPATAPQVTRIERARLTRNAQTCSRLGLARTCTQAQACTTAGAVGGASCTAAQARAANAEIFAATLAGREAFLQDIIRDKVQEFTSRVVVEDHDTFCTWWRTTASVAAKNNICTTTVPSLGTGCDLCP